MVPGKLDSYMQKNEIGLLFTPYTKINSKWIEHLNVRLEIIKLLKENIGSQVLDMGLITFVKLSPQA